MMPSPHYQRGKRNWGAVVLLCPGQEEEKKNAPAQGETGKNLDYLLNIMRNKYNFKCHGRDDLTITNASSEVLYEAVGGTGRSVPYKTDVLSLENLDRLADELSQTTHVIICCSNLAQKAVDQVQQCGKLRCGIRIANLPHLGNKALNRKYPDDSLPCHVLSYTSEEKKKFRLRRVACCLYRQIRDVQHVFAPLQSEQDQSSI